MSLGLLRMIAIADEEQDVRGSICQMPMKQPATTIQAVS
jgi:hypothetical protein